MIENVIHYKSYNNNEIMKVKVKEEEEEEGGDQDGRRSRQQQQRRRRPEWAELLLTGEYFGTCRAHGSLRKGEKNFFCIDCRRKMCFHCLARHDQKGHRHLQIRKYVYRDVIRVGDLHDLLDLSRIQPYYVNAAKVVHLKPRNKSNPSKSNSGGPTCQICRQNVFSNTNLFCSVACKLEAEMSDDNIEARSEPSTHDPTSDLDDNIGTDKEEQQQRQQRQRQQQQQQSYDDSEEENQNSRKQRRKGVPRRAPKF